jgi:single-strand selective monofunctional uracil DNA glycosylase
VPTAASPLVPIARDLVRAVEPLAFAPPVAFVYDPLVYAWAPHEAYLERYGRAPREVLLVGMNPGPFGMVQTGVPFGDRVLVREWLGIDAPVGRPPREHARRPVLGFECPRREVSGTRLWGWARDRFGTPERFFERFFVANWCPLAFLDEGGANRTPDRLPARERLPLEAACDAALRAAARALRVARVVGVGAYAAGRARVACAGLDVRVDAIPHPSPASPAANRGWAAAAEAALGRAGIRLP